MSFDELKEHQIFLPEDHWGEADLETTINVPALVTVGLVGIAACVAMILGQGRTLTWIGAATFIAFMIGFAVLSNSGIDRQNQRVDELLESE